MPIYFISDGRGYVKIGHSADPVNRLAQLQTGSPTQLNLLAICPGGPEREGELHGEFTEARMSGEWFYLTTEIKLFIASCQELYTMESFINQEKDRAIWDDAYEDWFSKTNKIDAKYQLLVDELERQWDAELDGAERELDERTDGIVPWWLQEK